MLVDTSGLLCACHKAEAQHAEAARLLVAAPRRLTHNYILAEFVALAEARRLPRPATLDFMAALQNDPGIKVVYVDESLHREALELLRRRPDKQWSLCDAVSFLLMGQHRLTNALTTDHHFEQAGFVRLLQP